MLAPLIYLLNFSSKNHQLCRTSGCDAVLWPFFTSKCHSDFLLIWKCSNSVLLPVCGGHCISWTWQGDWGMQVWVVSSYERDVEGVCKEPGDWLQVLISLRSQIKSHDLMLSIQLEVLLFCFSDSISVLWFQPLWITSSHPQGKCVGSPHCKFEIHSADILLNFWIYYCIFL